MESEQVIEVVLVSGRSIETRGEGEDAPVQELPVKDVPTRRSIGGTFHDGREGSWVGPCEHSGTDGSAVVSTARHRECSGGQHPDHRPADAAGLSASVKAKVYGNTEKMIEIRAKVDENNRRARSVEAPRAPLTMQRPRTAHDG